MSKQENILAQLMKKAGLNNPDVAKLVKCAPVEIWRLSNWPEGKDTRKMTVDWAQRLAPIFDVTPAQLLGIEPVVAKQHTTKTDNVVVAPWTIARKGKMDADNLKELTEEELEQIHGCLDWCGEQIYDYLDRLLEGPEQEIDEMFVDSYMKKRKHDKLMERVTSLIQQRRQQ